MFPHLSSLRVHRTNGVHQASFTTSQSHSFIPCTTIKRFHSCFLEACEGVNVQSFMEQFSPTAQGCLEQFCYSGPQRNQVSLSGNAELPLSFTAGSGSLSCSLLSSRSWVPKSTPGPLETKGLLPPRPLWFISHGGSWTKLIPELL